EPVRAYRVWAEPGVAVPLGRLNEPRGPTPWRRGALVSRVRDSMTKSGDAREDFIGRLGPHEWPRSFVRDLNVPPDGRLQLTRAAMHAASQLLVGERREPALDQVDPRGARRGEVHVVARMAHQPAVDERSVVCAVCTQYHGTAA